MLIAQDMANYILAELAGASPSVFTGGASEHLVSWSQGVIDELTIAGSATFGTNPSGHTISGMDGTSMANRIEAESTFYTTVTTQLNNFCDAIVSHIHSDAIVTYTSPTGLIPASLNYVNGGTISGLDGNTLAGLVGSMVPFPSTSAILIAFCTAVVDYIMANAEVEVGVIS